MCGKTESYESQLKCEKKKCAENGEAVNASKSRSPNVVLRREKKVKRRYLLVIRFANIHIVKFCQAPNRITIKLSEKYSNRHYGADQKVNERTMVFKANTLGYEYAMVIETTAAAFTQLAMLGRLRLDYQTIFAKVELRYILSLSFGVMFTVVRVREPFD